MEGTRQPRRMQAARVRVPYRVAAEGQPPGVAGMIASDHVEGRRLADSVGSDEGAHDPSRISKLLFSLHSSRPGSPRRIGQSIHREQRSYESPRSSRLPPRSGVHRELIMRELAGRTAGGAEGRASEGDAVWRR